jgi:DNA topoisomerase-2
LSERGYDLYPRDEKKAEAEDDNSDDEVEESATDAELAKGYEYLLGMKIWSLTFERAEELRRQRAEKAGEVDTLEGTSPESIWLTDLDVIDEVLNERDADIASDMQKEVKAQSKSKARVTKKAAIAAKNAKKTKKKAGEWDSDLEDDDSDDDFMISKSKPAPKPKAKRPVVKAAPVAKAPSPVVAKPPTPKDDVVSVLEKLSISDDKPAPVAKKAATKTKTAAPVKKAAPKKAPVKKKAPPKKKTYDSDSDDFMGDSDSDSSASVQIVAAPSRARSGRAAAKKITYVLSDSDSEGSDESFDEDF